MKLSRPFYALSLVNLVEFKHINKDLKALLDWALESVLPNFDFFVFPIFAIMLGYFKVQTIFSYATNTQA